MINTTMTQWRYWLPLGSTVLPTLLLILSALKLMPQHMAWIGVGIALITIVVALMSQKLSLTRRRRRENLLLKLERLQADDTHYSDELDSLEACFESYRARALKAMCDIGAQRHKLNTCRAALEASPGAWMICTPSGQVNRFSHHLPMLFGNDVKLEKNKDIVLQVPEGELRNFIQRFIAQRGNRRSTMPSRHYPEHLSPRSFNVMAVRLGKHKAELGILFHWQDSTRIEEATRSRDEFIGNLSHELKTPLQVIQMYCETLESGGDDDREIRLEAINTIRDESERITLLIQNMLNVTRLEAGSLAIRRRRTQLADLLNDLAQRQQHSAQLRNVTLEKHIPRILSDIYIDKELFSVAINNLLSNAIKYSYENSSVKFSIEETDEEISIIIEDSGIGIDVEEQEKIFNKFYRATNSDQSGSTGHGLGLALARRIIELHQGRIGLTSKLNHGSRFSIHLKKNKELIQEIGK